MRTRRSRQSRRGWASRSTEGSSLALGTAQTSGSGSQSSMQALLALSSLLIWRYSCLMLASTLNRSALLRAATDINDNGFLESDEFEALVGLLRKQQAQIEAGRNGNLPGQSTAGGGVRGAGGASAGVVGARRGIARAESVSGVAWMPEPLAPGDLVGGGRRRGVGRGGGGARPQGATVIARRGRGAEAP